MATLGYRSRAFAAVVFYFAATVRLWSQATPQSSQPPSDPATLLQAASAKEDAFATERQKYLCVFRTREYIANKQSVTTTDRLYESFYIHGYEIQRLLAIDGAPLSAEDKQAEEARVNREIEGNQKKPVIPFVGLAGGMSLSPGEHRWADTVQGSIIQTSIFTNERRATYRERPAIQIDFTGNPKFMPRTDEECVAQTMAGTIVVDEEDGAIVQIRARGTGPDIYRGNQLLTWPGAYLGFDSDRIARNLYVPSTWRSFRAMSNHPGHPAGDTDTVDFWLQSCREYTSEAHILPGVVPVQ